MQHFNWRSAEPIRRFHCHRCQSSSASLRSSTTVRETQRLESIYQQKLAALDALKKSLLHQAFTGEL